jgi:Carboxypeptidase regulatory-like domain
MLRYATFLLLITANAFAQTGQGTIVGRVTDTTSGIVPGVAVHLQHSGTGFTYDALTNEEGMYRIPYLNPGTYEITFEAQGFKKTVHSNITVRSTETTRVDVVLEIGQVVDSIEVKAETPLLETETSTVGHLVSGDIRNKLPTPQQKIQSILWYMPGVTSQQGDGHIGGQRSRAFVATMEGVSGMEPVRGEVATNRFLATVEQNIEEVKVLTTALPAEYGHSGGGIMNITYKSGSNQFHGLAEERYLSKKQIHRNWQDPNIPLGAFGYHMITGALSGPVIIPGLYDGHNKTFFLIGFQRHHEKASEDNQRTVPSPAMMAGDFSFGGIGDPIYDPLTTVRLADGTYSRTQFPGNQIPTSRFDPVAAKFLSLNPYTPENNRFNQAFMTRTGPMNNLSADTVYRSYRTGTDYKIDHSFSNDHKIFGRLSNYRHRSFVDRWNVQYANPIFDYNRTPIPIDQTQVVISDTITLSPRTINEIRVGGNRRKFSRVPESLDQNWAQQLGIPNVPGQTMPGFMRTDTAYLFDARFPEGKEGEVTENMSLQENLTMVRGRHTFKAGYELLRTRANSILVEQPSGRYTFGGTDFPFRPNTGNQFASFLLGSVVRAEFTQALATWLPRWWTHSLYFQDDWKVAPNLTLNLGLRWQYETPFNTKYGQQTQFSPDAIDPLTGRRGALLHPDGNLAARDLNNFQPRLGLAYNFAPNWVFRGGFAVNTLDLWTNGLRENFEEYLATAVVQQPTGDPSTAFYLRQGPPAFAFNVLPDGTVPFLGTNYSGRAASYYDPNMRSPYILNWNAGLQFQLGGSLVLEANYQGSSGVGLLNRWDINAIPLDIATTFDELNRVRTASQNYRPYPHFGAINHYANYGHNSFHSGTLKIDKRYSMGFNLTSFYTWSKALDEASNDSGAGGITFYNRRLEKGRSNYDVAHRWVTYGLYDLPFGRGRKFASNGNGFVNKLISDWRFGMIQTIESGAPFGFTFAGSDNVFLPGAQRPNLAPGKTYDDIQIPYDRSGPCRHIVSCREPWADLNAFSYPASFTPGQTGRNIINSPGMVWHQVTLAKTILVGERVKGTLRVDVNNPFKVPWFSAPNNSVNFRNSESFGKITGQQGSFSGLSGRLYTILIFNLEF